jgi:hypothetical protein
MVHTFYLFMFVVRQRRDQVGNGTIFQDASSDIDHHSAFSGFRTWGQLLHRKLDFIIPRNPNYY